MHRLFLCCLAVASVALLLAGCGGGDGGKQLTPGVALTVGATTVAGNSATKLNAGSTAVAYDFRTGAELDRGQLDANGRCDLQLTPSLPVLVVITGLQGTPPKEYRLSLLIPSVPATASEPFIATPITSIAAEAVASKHYHQNLAIDPDVYDNALTAAAAYVGDNPGADYSLDGTLFTGTIGELGDGLQPIIDDVPEPGEIKNNVILAKNAVAQMKEAGMPLSAMVSQEAPNIDGFFSETVSDAYGALNDKLSTLLLPALLGDMYLVNESYDWRQVGIFDLNPGTAYRVVDNYYGSLDISADGTTDANKVLVTYTTGATTYTLVGTQVGANAILTQTCSSEAAMEYKITVSNFQNFADGPGVNPSSTLSISLKDSHFSTPLTYVGTINAVGADKAHYTSISYNGTLTTPHVQSTGTLTATFPATVPAHAEPGADIYDFPKSFTWSNGTLTLKNGTDQISVTGSANLTTAVILDGGVAEIALNYVKLDGSYADTKSGLAFEGHILGNWDNPAPKPILGTSTGSLRLTGSLLRNGYPTYAADLQFGLATGSVSTTISLQAGASTLQGSGSGTIVSGKVTNPTLTLTNQAGVKFTFATNVSGNLAGTVTVGAEEVGTIGESPYGGVRITYKGTPVSYDDF